MSNKFEPLNPAQLAEEIIPPPPPTEQESKVSKIIADARKRERRMRAKWEAKQELDNPGQWEHDPYKAPSTEELHRIAEETLPTEELKRAIKEKEGA